MSQRTLYEILDVEEAATPNQIKDAYRRQAMKWHPDRNPNSRTEAEARFKEIGYAYKVLSDSVGRAAYDAELSASRGARKSEQSHAENDFEQAFSQQDASAVFFEQMLDLAIELASRGYGDALIAKALIGLDCPELVAKQVAALATKSGRSGNDAGRAENDRTSQGAKANEADDNQKKDTRGAAATDTTNRRQGEVSESLPGGWESIEPFFSAALVGPNFVPSASDQSMGVGAVRIGVALALAGFFSALFLYQQGPNDFDSAFGVVILAILLGWGCMFSVFQFSELHRRYIAAERLDSYLPIFREMVASKKYLTGAPGSLLFPVPWFGYYGLYWPLIAVIAIFATSELIVLQNVESNILAQGQLLSIWEILQHPLLYMVFWSILAYAFPYLLFVRIKSVFEEHRIQGLSDEHLKRAMFSRCKPKLWRAALATVIFFGCLAIPGLVLKQQQERIEVALAAKKLSPQKAFDAGLEIVRSDSGDITKAYLFLLAAAEKNHADAEYVIGIMFAHGDRIARDQNAAQYWLDRATSHGSAKAPMVLGYYFSDGMHGFPIDQKKGVAYWKIAADKGEPSSQVSIGWSYMLGLGGLPTDFAQAAYWNRKGADGGNREGYNNLGWQYEHGLGVGRDYAQAAALYKKGSDMGSKEAGERLETLEIRRKNMQLLGYPQESISELQIGLIADGMTWNYAEFDPRSNRFNAEVTNRTLALQKTLIQQGAHPVAALHVAAHQVVRDFGLKRRE